MYLKLCINVSGSNMDFAIVYNNLSRIYMYLEEYSYVYHHIKLAYDYFKLEAEKITKQKYNLDVHLRANIEVISFLYYSYAICIEKLGKLEESQYAFRKGYEFSVAFLGENNFITAKYPRRINKNFDVAKLSSITNDTFPSSPNDSNTSFILKTDFSRKNNRKLSLLKDKKFIKGELSFDDAGKQKINRSGSADVEDLKHKMDLLLKKVEKFNDFEKTLNEVIRSRSKDAIEVPSSRRSSMNNLRKYLVKNLLTFETGGETKAKTLSNYKGSPIEAVTSKTLDRANISKEEIFLNEFVNQLEMGEFNISKASKPSPKLPAIERAGNRSPNTVSFQGNTKKSIKDMFTKAIGEFIPKEKGGLFTQMFRELRSDDINFRKTISTVKTSEERTINDTISPKKDYKVVKKKSLKDQLKKESNKFAINVTLDGGNDDYVFKNLIFKDNNYEKVKTQLRKPVMSYVIKVDKDETDINKYEYKNLYIKNQEYINKKDFSKKNIVDEIIDLETFNTLNCKIQLKLVNKSIKVESPSKDNKIRSHLSKLILKHTTSNKKFCILREYDNINIIYKIVISYNIRNGANGILLELFRDDEPTVSIYDYFITFDKLKSLSTKIHINNSLPSLVDIHTSIKSLDQFIEKVFIYFTLISISKGKPSINIVARPVGTCNSIYEFTFLKAKCIIDFLVHQNETVFFIHHAEAETKTLKILLELDEMNFKTIFYELQFYNNGFVDENEVNVRNFRLSDRKHLSKTGFISYVILKVQEIFKTKYNDNNLTFEGLFDLLKNTQIRLKIENDLTMFSLWLLSDKGETVSVDYYTLNRIISI
jgi:hypothetical protein